MPKQKKLDRDWVLLIISSLSLIGLAMLDSSCTRDTGGSATLTLTLPSSSSFSTNSNSIHDLSWGQTAPTTFTGLNCFFVMVSGPESSMNNSSCALANGSTLPIGISGGSFASGSTINLAVPAGQNRTVNIIGLYSDGAVACPSLANINNNQSHFSNPVFLGSVGQVNMAEGATVNLNIPVTASISNSTFDLNGCAGPLFSSNGGGGGVPTALKIVWQDNLSALHTSSCIPVSVIIVDSSGNNASVNSTYPVTLSPSGGNFYQDSTCSSATVPSVNFSSFSTWNGFYGAPGSATTLTLSASATGLTTYSSAGIPITTGVTSKLGFVDIRTMTTMAAGATVPAYTCRNILMQAQDATGIPTGTTYSASAYAQISTGSLIYSISDNICANTGSSSQPSQSLTNGNYPFNFMGTSSFSSLSSANSGSLNTAVGSSTNFSMSSTAYVATPTLLQIVPLSPTASGNNNGQSSFGASTGNCVPMEVAFTDAAYNRGLAGTSGTISFLEDGVTATHFWTSSSCVSTALTSLGVSGSDWHKVFYVKITTAGESHVLAAALSGFTGASVTVTGK